MASTSTLSPPYALEIRDQYDEKEDFADSKCAIVTVLKDGLATLHVPYAYGFAIILLTVIVKVATLPLTKKQHWTLEQKWERHRWMQGELGANAILVVSIAACKAGAAEKEARAISGP
ncbi:uncharacterized protein LOC131229610 isoform X2 [Magnolia sinica]|uniref:uncharacterized protein LOC131229610 isoform X2 n=1 Tax=Magnolia sinica TaxID=86752 RepID=UPI0026593265|nr:uncharacterized protein LOC131229610 isoform X2 [Magnolia sinica]